MWVCVWVLPIVVASNSCAVDVVRIVKGSNIRRNVVVKKPVARLTNELNGSSHFIAAGRGWWHDNELRGGHRRRQI